MLSNTQHNDSSHDRPWSIATRKRIACCLAGPAGFVTLTKRLWGGSDHEGGQGSCECCPEDRIYTIMSGGVYIAWMINSMAIR
jgi:hypothetical protein